MRINLTLILSIVLINGIIALGFTAGQIVSERNKMKAGLEARITQIAEDIVKSQNSFTVSFRPEQFNQFADSINQRYGTSGMAIYFSGDSIVYDAPAAPFISESMESIATSVALHAPNGLYLSSGGTTVYEYIIPVENTRFPGRAFVLKTDATFIGTTIGKIWLSNFIRWFLQVLLVSAVTIIIIRLRIVKPINNVIDWVKAARVGNIPAPAENSRENFLDPLRKEVEQIAIAMQDAKAKAAEEARLRRSGEDIWTAERLKLEVESLLNGKMMVVISNREPYMHIHEGKDIRCIMPASGMITAMEPVLNACGGLWIASGSGDADKETVDRFDKLNVPPEDPKYVLRRIWLTKEEEDHYYYGFSNEGLWPLCHIAHTRPTFRKEDWEQYQKVNQRFADAVLEETKNEEQPFILIQDYHFALLPEMIKQAKPEAKVALFWHIPWPNPESFGICPWQNEILTGMLGADLIGFHTQYHCNHFLETVNNVLESRVIWENFAVKMKFHTTHVQPFPISIDFTQKDLENNPVAAKPSAILLEHGIHARFMGVGVDRIDYTKGIEERFLAIERFLEKFPEYIEQFTFVQIGAPSRTLLKSYADLVSTVENEADRINWKFKTKNWKPILLLKRHHSHEEIRPYYAAANVCLVTSLHDGMNLVAKEFIAARSENNGVLILSRFAGAAKELQGAIVINPYDIEKTADALRKALTMESREQKRRMKQMRQTVIENNVYTWGASLIKTMTTV